MLSMIVSIMNHDKAPTLREYVSGAIIVVCFCGIFFEELRYSLFGATTEASIVQSEMVEFEGKYGPDERLEYDYEFSVDGKVRRGQSVGTSVGDYRIGRRLLVQYIPGTDTYRLAGVMGRIPRFVFAIVSLVLLLGAGWMLRDVMKPFGKS